jgi:hypothetical protein
MRTTPLHQWVEQGEKFDSMIRSAAGRILGITMSDRMFAQAALTPKLGGLGLRKSVEHADFAYSASWHESQRQARETWIRPGQVSLLPVPQSQASYEFDEAVHAYLVDTAPTEREKQRLLRVAQPHAGAFVTALPSQEEDKDTIMRPRIYRTAVAYRLGAKVLNNEIPCPLCTQPINIYGDHATCCAKSGDLVIRHNTLRNLVASIASSGLLNPVLEKQGILGNTSGRRPGDVTIPNWESGNALAIDVAVTSPLLGSSVRVSKPCEEYAANKKHRKYDPDFKGSAHSFCAIVWETLGAINVEGEAVLQQLFSFAVAQLGREFTSFCGRSWARVSCSLQRTVAQAILARIDGNQQIPVFPLVGGPFVEEPLVGQVPLGKSQALVFEPSVGSVGESPFGKVSKPKLVPPQIPICPFVDASRTTCVTPQLEQVWRKRPLFKIWRERGRGEGGKEGVVLSWLARRWWRLLAVVVVSQ